MTTVSGGDDNANLEERCSAPRGPHLPLDGVAETDPRRADGLVGHAGAPARIGAAMVRQAGREFVLLVGCGDAPSVAEAA